MLDLVPVSKITAFGADYRVTVQKAWGHLVMAREAVASALSRRVDAREMTFDRAVDIAIMWFNDNPARIYRV